MSRRHQPEVTEPRNLGPDAAAMPSLTGKILLYLHSPLRDGEGHLLHCFVSLKTSVIKAPMSDHCTMNDTLCSLSYCAKANAKFSITNPLELSRHDSKDGFSTSLLAFYAFFSVGNAHLELFGSDSSLRTLTLG